jgi:hypothetical protein
MPRLLSRSTILAAAATLALATVTHAVPTFQTGVQTGLLPSALIEASGIVASRAHANVLWSHNDSGNSATAYAMTPAGTLLGSYALSGATNTDWEDIAMGPAPAGGTYLYMGDIGDNNSVRSNIKVYRTLEPTVSATQSPVSTTLTGVTAFTFVYEDGPHDAESLIVDPLDGSFYVITKRDALSRVYRCASPSATATNTLTRVGTLGFTGATGADISPDGSHILIRRYSGAEGTATPASTAASYYTRAPGETFIQALGHAAEIVPLRQEFQGEAIGFAGDGNGFYTTSEKTTTAVPPIYFYGLVPEPSALALILIPALSLIRRR